uniref:Uncharacterized protein n=1 Tax=Anguilla anguilla TaxID=7936 RepID=A0A0E9PN96_ANGAN
MRWDFLLQAGSERSPNGKKKNRFHCEIYETKTQMIHV